MPINCSSKTTLIMSRPRNVIQTCAEIRNHSRLLFFSILTLSATVLPAPSLSQTGLATDRAADSQSASDPSTDASSDSKQASAAIDVAENFALAQPFAARFDIQLDGKPMGYGEMTLQRLPDIDGRDDLQQFEVLFTSKATSGIAKLARFRGREETSFVVQDNRVYPLLYAQNESMLFSKDVWQASFNWRDNKLSVSSKDGNWDQAMQEQTVDSLSIYLLLASQAVRTVDSFALSLLKEDKIAAYQWQLLPNATVSNQCGEFDTVVYQGNWPGTDKTIWTWHAPALHWLPVRIRKNRDEDSYFQIDLNAIAWDKDTQRNCGQLQPAQQDQ